MTLAVPLLASAQVPVTITSDIPRIIEFVSTEAQWGTQNGYSVEQIAQLTQTAQTVRQEYASLTGDRGMTGMFSSSFAEQSFLPATYTEMQTSRSGQYGARMSASEAANAILTETILNALPAGQRAIVQRARQAVSMQSTVGAGRYEQATNRDADLKRYFDRAGSCADLKCSTDLNVVVGVKGLMLQNDIIKGQALDQAMRAERNAAEAREHEAYLQSIGSVRSRAVVTHEYQP